VSEFSDKLRAVRIGLPVSYLSLMAAIFSMFVAAFLITETLVGTPFDEPARFLRGDFLGAATGAALLTSDAVLPLPSSLIMLALGALLGYPAAMLASLAGSVGAALAGYGLGRWAGPALLGRICPESDRAQADRLVSQWGLLAVAVSRPIPLVAETVMVAAGASRLGAGRTMLAAALGALPGCVMFTVAGEHGLTGPSGILVFVTVVTVVAVSSSAWFVVRRWRKQNVVLEPPEGA